MFKKIVLICMLTLSNIGLVSAFEASYYSDVFEGGTSANGTTFSQSGHTAAICYEELSQLAYVSTAHTGMVVTLTDRPNCARHTDRIDLSSSVFSTFAPLSKGLIADISATPLGIKTGKFVKRNLSQKDFYDYSVELFSPISNTFFAGESIKIKGRVLNSKKQVVIFLKNKHTGEKYTHSYLVASNGYFDILFSLPKHTGEYFFKILSISPGEELTIQNLESILVVDNSLFSLYPTQGKHETKKFSFNQTSVSADGLTIDLKNNTWGRFLLSQDKQTSTIEGQILLLSGTNLSIGEAKYYFTGYTLSSPSSLDIAPGRIHTSSGVVLIDRIRESTEYGSINIKKFGKVAQFRFRVKAGFLAKPNFYVSLPNGDVREYSINKKFIESNGFLKTNTLIIGSFPVPDRGTYRLEINQDSGIAYINIPFYTDFTLPITVQDYLLLEGETYEIRVLDSINSIRRSLGRNLLTIDPDLSRIAHLKARDMYVTNTGSSLGVSHTNSKGKDISFFANFYGVTRSRFGENVAGSNNITKTAILELHDGLEESPAHRSNMISPNFSKVGIGYYQKGGYSYLVHIFSN